MEFWQVLNANGDAIAAVSAIGTLFVAMLVYMEAKTIRKTEWIINQNAAWNDMSAAVAAQSNECDIGDILMGNKPHDELTTQEEYLLMMFLNVVNSEYNGFRAKAISPRWVLHSFGMTAGIAASNREWLVGFMQKYGYQRSFIRIIALLPLAADNFDARAKLVKRELLASGLIGRLLGRRFRSWLRRDHSDEIMQRLFD